MRIKVRIYNCPINFSVTLLGSKFCVVSVLTYMFSEIVAAVVLWGDPRHNQAEQTSIVVGFPTAKQDGYFPRTTNQTDILLKYYSKKLVSYCTEGDKYC